MVMTTVFGVDLSTPGAPAARSRPSAKEKVMGFFSWLSSCGSRFEDEIAEEQEQPTLVHRTYETPKLEEIQRAAAEDVARVQQDDKYFGKNSPGSHEDDL
jgi:hypothetical protein